MTTALLNDPAVLLTGACVLGVIAVLCVIEHSRRLAHDGASAEIPGGLAALLCLSNLAAADDRWDVKTLMDPGHARVVETVIVPTTIRALSALIIPRETLGPRGRHVRSAPVETTVWSVTARLLSIEREGDNDFHVILSDGVRTMIAEVPDPDENPRYAARWRAIRAALPGLVGQLVKVEGVGFFDPPHAPFCAKNGIELHPVLAVRRAP